jgi:hypothetical protein
MPEDLTIYIFLPFFIAPVFLWFEQPNESISGSPHQPAAVTLKVQETKPLTELFGGSNAASPFIYLEISPPESDIPPGNR